MFAGHLGAALALGRAEPRLNVGVLVAAALLLDAVLWLLILVGIESARIPADFASTHQPDFSFPYSHGLVAALVWAALAGALAFAGVGAARRRAAGLVAAAVLSHWLLDALVHRPELPLLGLSSTAVGLGLWNHMPFALAVEGVVTALGLWLFLADGKLARGRALGLAALLAVAFAFTVAGMTVAPPPPSALAMAASSLAAVAAVTALSAWLGRSAAG